MREIKYLVFGGGGTAGYAYGGALEQLGKESTFSFDNIHGVGGSSVGAIAALLVSLNYTPEEMINKFKALDFNKFNDGGTYITQMWRLFTHYGKYNGDALYELVKNILREKTTDKGKDPEKITFEDFKNWGFKDLHIVATKKYIVNEHPTGKQIIFSTEKSPKTSVALAIRASIAAPSFFTGIRLKKIAKGEYVPDPTGDLYDDGGNINNFPIEIFDKPQYLDKHCDSSIEMTNPATLGFALVDSLMIKDKSQKDKIPKKDKQPIRNNSFLQYCTSFINTLFYQIEKAKMEQRHLARTIRIDRCNVQMSNFDLSTEKKIELFDSGKNAVTNYFAKLHQFALT